MPLFGIVSNVLRAAFGKEDSSRNRIEGSLELY